MADGFNTERAETLKQDFVRLLQEHHDEVMERLARRVAEVAGGLYAETPLEELRLKAEQARLAFHYGLVEDPEIFVLLWEEIGKERVKQGYTISNTQNALTALHQIMTEFLIEHYSDDPEAEFILYQSFSDMLDKARIKLSEVYVEVHEQTITEYQRLEREREEAEGQYQILFNNIQDGVFIIQETVLYLVNEAFANMVGYTVEEVIGSKFTEYVAPEDMELVISNYQRRLRGEPSPDEYEFRMLHKDGVTRVYVNMSVGITTYQGKPASIGTMKNITERRQAEEALRDSEIRFRAIFEEAPIGISLADADGRILGNNPAMDRMLGYSSEDLGGKSFTEYTHPEDAIEEMELYQQLVEGKRDHYRLEKRYIRKDGQFIWASLTVTPVRNQQGEFRFTVCLVEDVTERRQLERQLVDSERKYRGIVDRALIGIYRTTIDGRLLEANPYLMQVSGYNSSEDLSKHNVADLYSDPDDRNRIMSMLREGPVQGFESKLQSANGQIIDVSLSAYIVHDDQGKPMFIEGFVEDITKRKQAEEALRLTQFSIDHAVDDIFWMGPDGKLLYVNEAACRHLGYSREELLSMSVWDFDPSFSQERWQTLWQELKKRGSFTIETTNQTKDGRTFPVEANINYVEFGGKEYNFSFSHDISERKQLEQQTRESLELRSRQVQTSTDVAQEIAAAPALEELFHRVVTLVKERFGYYHTQVFRSDPETGDMLLVEGYGEAGRKMKAAGHKIKYGKGVVGTAANNKQPVLAPDVSKSTVWLPNPHLPDTKGELAVPIMLRDRVLGVLDVQSEQAGYLSEEDQLLLLGLCGQIASAIESTRLLEEANVFRQFTEAAGQGMGMTALDGEIIYANRALCRLIEEAGPEEISGKHFTSYYPEEIEQRLRDEILPTTMREGEWTGEMALLSSQKKITPTIENFFLIRNEKGEPLYLADVITDISGRKQTEEKLRDSQTLYQSLVDALPQSVYRVDLDGKIVFGNKAYCKGLGYPLESLVGKTVYSFFPQELADKYTADDQTVVQTGNVLELVEPHKSPTSAEIRYVQVVKTPVRDYKGDIVGIQGIFWDITERRQAETEMEVALRELSTLYRRYSRETWEKLLRAETGKRRIGYVYDQQTTTSTGDYVTPLEAEAQEQLPAGPKEADEAVLTLPLKVRGEDLGQLELEKEGGWSEEEVSVAEAIASQLALSIDSARLFDETQESLEETNMLYRAAGRFSKSTTIDEIVNILGQQLDEMLPEEFGYSIYLALSDPDKPPEWVENKYTRLLPGSTTQEAARIGTRLSAEIFPDIVRYRSSRAPLLIADVMTDSKVDPISRQILATENIRSMAVAPIITSEHWWGFISIFSREQRVPDERQMRLLGGLLNQAAMAIESRWLIEQTQALARREQLINRVSSKVGGYTDIAAIMQTAVQELSRIMGSSRVYIQLGTEEDLTSQQPPAKHPSDGPSGSGE